MVRTATLDLNSRGSFVDDLNSKPGIVMCRDALLHRSHEIQPAFFDSEIKNFSFIRKFFFSSFFFIYQVTGVWHLPSRGFLGLGENMIFFIIFFIMGAGMGIYGCAHKWIQARVGSSTGNQRQSSNQDFRIEFRY